MAEGNKTASAPPTAPRSGTGFELRLERGGASVRLADREVAPGLQLQALSLRVPDVKLPFDAGQGAAQFRHRLSDLTELRIAASAPFVEATLAQAPLEALGLSGVRAALREGFAELSGRLAGGPAFTLKAGLLAEGEAGFRIVFHSPRLFAPAPVAAAALPHLAAQALAALGARALEAEPLAPLLRQVLAPRGWKLPRAAGVRLARAELAGGQAVLAWTAGAAGPATVSADGDLLAAEEGARTFAAAEAALAKGDLDAARERLLEAGPAAAAHPFGAERLLSLLAVEERFHDEALDLAAEWLGRRPGFAPALMAEALVRLARGEEARAARALAALAQGAAERGEAFGALAAAEATFSLAGAAREDAQKAVELALAQRRDHVPALRALRALAAAAGDREALLRADRRIVAYDPDDAEKARAHAELGELLLQADPPAARLHLDQALRLAPEDPGALAALSRACAAAGEPLRSVRALDRLRALHAARGDRPAAAAAALEAAALWEGPLAHPENALLRYREAAELAPSADVHARAAAAAERLGQWQEAADHHAAVLAALDPAAPGAPALLARTRVALADVAERRLGDPAAAAGHLQAAAAAAPADAALLHRLAGLERGLGRPDGLAAALDRLAALALPGDPPRAAALLAEAGEAFAAAGQPAEAQRRFAAALTHDPSSRPALLGLAEVARSRGDALAERDALARLLAAAGGAPAGEVAALQDRIADAAGRAGDVAGAAAAAHAAREAEPTRERLAAELALLRRAGDGAAVAALLPEVAAQAAAGGDAPAAAAAWLERATLLADADAPAALAALAEARAAAPGDAEVLRAQAALAERAGDAKLALGSLRALLAGAAPGDAPALEVRAARAALQAGEAAAAVEHAERALAARSPEAGALLAELVTGSPDRAALLARLSRPAEAAALLQSLGRAGDAAELLERVGRPLEAAELWIGAGDGDRALAALERAADDEALAAAALPRLSELRLAGGDARGAAAALLRLARRAGGREGALLALRAHALDPDPGALDVAVSADPGFAPARARRALARAGQDPRAALSDAEAALAGEVDAAERPALLALAAGCAASLGDGDAARRHLAAYCEVAPADDAALARLAALHRLAGDRPALAEVLDRRRAVAAGADAVAVRLERAALAAGAGDEAQAVALLEEALERDPASLAALRALTAPARGAAVAAARRAELLARLAGHPDAPADEAAAAERHRAQLLSTAGDHRAALAALRVAAALGPEDDAALELRALVASRAGDAAGAAEALEARAARALAAGEPGAGDRLAEAALAALAAGLPGAPAAIARAVEAGPGRDLARALRAAQVDAARAAGDTAGERAALAPLVPLLPTGARPAALLRLSALALAAGDVPAARAAADEARVLAPRDPEAIDAARAAAEAAGDREAVAERLGELAERVPERRGTLLLEQARLLAAVARHEDADRAFGDALPALPPDRRLADAHALHRRAHLPRASAAEPLEAYARREGVPPPEAARALRAGAALALHAGDMGGALRCARRAYARTQEDLGFAGPLLARILYLGGAAAEALVLHRRLFEAGLDKLPPEDALAIARQLAELAEDWGDLDLARAALEEVLSLRPSDMDAALRRFALDPDRGRAARDLAAQADLCRSAARRAEALAAAAEAALGEVADASLADALFRRARDATRRLPARAAAVARRRVDAFRAAEGQRSFLLAEALDEAAQEALERGDREEARALLADAAARARDRGQLAAAAAHVDLLERLALEDDDRGAAAGHAREASELHAWAGNLPEAAAALQRALALEPGDAEARALLEAIARAMGPEGEAILLDQLARRLATAEPGPERAAVRVGIAEVRRAQGDLAAAEAELSRALSEDPGSGEAADALAAVLGELGRGAERGRLLLARAGALPPEEAAGLRRDAARALQASEDPADRALAAETWTALAAAEPADVAARREAGLALAAAGRSAEALPHLSAALAATPDDDAVAEALAGALAGDPAALAEHHLARAGREHGEPRAARLHQAARAFLAAGQDARARTALRQAFEAWPADDTAFVAVLADAVTDVDRIDAVLAARAGAVPREAAACHRARADALASFGRTDRAIAAYQAALAKDPGDAAALASLGACLAAEQGDDAAAEVDARLVAHAADQPGEVAASAEAPARYRLGLAAAAAGRHDEALRHLEKALVIAPEDERTGQAWAALAAAHDARGDLPMALAAARARAERAVALGVPDEWRAALEAGAALALRTAEGGRDAAELLDALLDLRAGEAGAPEALAELGRHTAAALEAVGEPARARSALVRGGIDVEPELAPVLRVVGDDGPEPQPAEAASDSDLATGSDTGSVPASDVDAVAEPVADAVPAADAASDLAADSVPAAGAPVDAVPASEAVSASEPAAEALAPAETAPAPEPESAPEPLEAAADLAPAPAPAAEPPPAPVGSPPPLAASVPPGATSRFADPFAEAFEAARRAAQLAAERALAATDPAERCAAFVAYADALDAAGASTEDLYTALDLAADADPDAARPFQARARLAAVRGDRAEAARAHLAASLRTEGAQAAGAALEAARLFGEAGLPADALRAFRAAVHAHPGCAPARAALAEDALEAGDADAAVSHLTAIDQDALHPAERTAYERRLARACEAAGRTADAEATWTALLWAEPGDGEAFASAAALALARGDVDAWLALAGRRDAALGDDVGARAALAATEGEVLRDAGRLDEARAALDRALALDPAHAPAREALERLEAELAAAAAPPEVAAQPDALAAPPGDATLADDFAAAPPEEPAQADDAVARVLRAQAEAAEGVARAELFERLAGHLERNGERAGAADALLAALAADPERELTLAWLRGLAAGDPERLAQAEALHSAAPASGDAGDAPVPGDAFAAPDAFEAEEAFAAAIPPSGALAPGPRAADAAPTGWLEPPLSPFPQEPGAADEAAAAAAAGPAAFDPDPLPVPIDPSPADDVPVLDIDDLELLSPGELAGAATAPEPQPARQADPTAAAAPAAAGRAALAASEWEAAYDALSEALSRDPTDLTLARDLARAAEKLGRHDRYVDLAEACLEAYASHDPLAAAARLRHLAEVRRIRLDQPDRAAVLLEKALALVPDDPDTLRELAVAWADVPSRAPRALDVWLGLARAQPSDAAALAAIALLCERLADDAPEGESSRLRERGRSAAALAAFVEPSGAMAPPPTPPAGALPPDARRRAAAPGAAGPVAELLTLLAPWLEPLFPADLGRRGASTADWLAPPRAPALRGALDLAARALHARPHAVFLTGRSGVEAAIENTQPPAVIFTAGAADLPPAGLAFLSARTLDLVQNGWALAGKFAPGDVLILLELACRFAGGAPPSTGLPADRAGAFLAALERTVPATVRERALPLAAAASAELASVDPRALATGLRRTANRMGLLHAGDPREALRVLALLERRADAGPLDLAAALDAPDLKDLALFALSDVFVDLRVAVG